MDPKACNIILLISIILFSTTTSIYAFNITYFLAQRPEFSTYNDLLAKSGVAAAINKQGTVTVLVVDNSAVAPLMGIPKTTLEYILATQVILDYYDAVKLGDLEKPVKATNLFQQTGRTTGGQGQTNISNTDGDTFFGSTAKGAPQDSKMVKVVASQPFHISVIQISKPIITPGLEQGPPAPPTSSPTVAPPTPTEALSPEADAPAPAPADDDAADSPDADSEGPAPASGPAPGPAPQGDEADKEAPAKAVPHKNGGVRLTVGGAMVAGLMGLVALSH
ncbi:hypothetical protein SOVF_196650 [Spinacia oleracea]|uniref:Fasciclin-like arabinogalactan protein 3 n=1 Tax=Spinacia oleracea TaxID=3562 RepID=A0A9R0J412_SPIOL|nr:fasciclin-like arabinogalactan protein 3 [Spinacia oleracea]KNA04767.1 hypothetical protein SOVF_196650 [Spinacia oleracea]